MTWTARNIFQGKRPFSKRAFIFAKIVGWSDGRYTSLTFLYQHHSGCSSVRLEYTSGGRVVAGSNPAIPTTKSRSDAAFFLGTPRGRENPFFRTQGVPKRSDPEEWAFGWPHPLHWLTAGNPAIPTTKCRNNGIESNTKTTRFGWFFVQGWEQKNSPVTKTEKSDRGAFVQPANLNKLRNCIRGGN